MATITTTKGPIDSSALARTVGFEDRPTELVLWVEWRLEGELVRRDPYQLPKPTEALIYTTLGLVDVSTLVRTIELSADNPGEFVVAVVWRLAGETVKRDVHLILKQPSVTATAVVGGF